MADRQSIRVCEWSRTDASILSRETRTAIEEASASWRDLAGLGELPVWFSGADGTTLCSCQHVGVIEVDDTTIEIVPKLDSHLIGASTATMSDAARVMDSLLWILSACGYMDLTDADRADLRRDEIRYLDLFAYIFAKKLLAQLRLGVPHTYVSHHDDLRSVRGAIDFSDQVTRNWNRLDRISCQWDEFTSDTPLNRIFKATVYLLRRRVHHGAVTGLLEECFLYYEETTLMDARSALQSGYAIRWSRANDRFRDCFDLAMRLLSGGGFQLSHASSRTFVFLLDMNRVFESFVGTVLQSVFGLSVEEQQPIGHLFTAPKRIRQIPDFQWGKDGQYWIGDAKYKRLDQSRSQFWDETNESDTAVQSAYLGPQDIRQLTIYAELLRRDKETPVPPRVMVLYPAIGEHSQVTRRTAWNGSILDIVPVRVDREMLLKACIPSGFS